MSYCILRTKKLKTISAVARSGRHTFREDATPNADQMRTPSNRLVGSKSSPSLLGALRALLPEKRRKDAVLAIEYLVTASPEFFRGEDNTTVTHSNYFNAALEFLRLKHGKKNIISAALHLDETTPHLVVYAVPLNVAGKLCAKDFLGGRAKLTQLQTDFHERVGAKFGLKRGVQGSRARHQDVKKFYAGIQEQPELESLTTLDKIAGVLGIKTAAAKAREHQEFDLLAHAQAHSRKSMLTVKSEQSRLAEKVKSEQRRSVVLAHRLDQVRDTALQLEIALAAATTLVEVGKQLAADQYQRNQILQTMTTFPTNALQQENHNAPKIGKSGLAQ